jgi:hypothetical protein
VPTVITPRAYCAGMDPGKQSRSLTELIDQLDNIREELLRIQRSLEDMEPKHVPESDGNRAD